MTTRNLLRESIVQVELLKQASAQATKDKILATLAEDVKRKLRQEEQQEVEQDQQETTVQEPIQEDDMDLDQEDDMNIDQAGEQMTDTTLQDIDKQIEQALADMDLDQEDDMNIDQADDMDLDQADDMDLDQDDDAALQREIEEQLADAQIEEEIEDELSEQDQTIEQEVDEELFEKIKGLINSELEPDEDTDAQVVAEFKQRVKKLTTENKRYKNAFVKIKQDLFETRMLDMKGKLLVSLFNKFELTKKQQMKLVQRMDSVNSEKSIKLLYSKLVEGLRNNKNITKKHKTVLISDNVKSTKPLNNKKTKTSKDLDESLIPIRDIFRRKVGILD